MQILGVAMKLYLPCTAAQEGARRTDPLYAEAWRWRENLQRAIDGCHTTDEMSSAGLAAYSELKGPNMPLSCGYSVSNPFPCTLYAHDKGSVCRHIYKTAYSELKGPNTPLSCGSSVSISLCPMHPP